jgi:CubicO group peptidase (beta-lactamase class C family)
MRPLSLFAAGVTPFDGNTVFEIGSITKTFTASILADMVKKGELSPSDPVEKFLPSVRRLLGAADVRLPRELHDRPPQRCHHHIAS